MRRIGVTTASESSLRSAQRDPKTAGLGADPREVPAFFCLDRADQILYAANADEGFSDEQNTDTIVPFRMYQARPRAALRADDL